MSNPQAEPEDILLERVMRSMPHISRSLKDTVRSSLREVMEGYKREQDVDLISSGLQDRERDAW